MAEPTTEPEVVAGSNARGVVVTEHATAYTILRFNNDTDEWIEYGDPVAATSAQAAIREHVNKTTPAQTGTYVAVPARSWKPVTVQAVQSTTLKLTEAS